MDVIFVPNMLHVYTSSNSDWVIPASHDERRYFVLDVLDTQLGDRPYFNALLQGDGRRRPRRNDLRHVAQSSPQRL